MDRRAFLALGIVLVAAPVAAEAQQAGTVSRIAFLGFVRTSSSGRQLEALRTGLSELGHAEGKNIVIDVRWADGNDNRLRELAAELVRLNVNVIVTNSTPATFAAKAATQAIPIVMVNTGDAVATGLVSTLARPGGNITGVTILSPELMVKRVEVLIEVFPQTRQVAVLLNPLNPAQGLSFQAAEAAARSLRLRVHRFEVRGPAEFEGAFLAMAAQRVDAVAITQDSVLLANSMAIADLANKRRLPSAGPRYFAEAGGLIGYGVDNIKTYYRAASYVDKILKGAMPGDLPVEQPTQFELVINLKTAKALGLTIPPPLLLRADQVIE